MVYVTTRQSPMYKQMTLEELLYDNWSGSTMISSNKGNTHTIITEKKPEELMKAGATSALISELRQFNVENEKLFNMDRHSMYSSFHIPKRSGGLRKIDAPNQELSKALRDLKGIFENDFGALYHTSAFAYVKGRSTIDSVKRHQANESRWFGKYDLSNFFGSTTKDFVVRMFSLIYPFAAVIEDADGRAEFEKAIDLAFLDGGLPQGTPISPIITNIMMIPIDHEICNKLRNFNGHSYVYTRYADDFLVSSRHSFSFKEIENFLVQTMSDFGAPFSLNRAKTRYGSRAGSNWNLGVMLNKDNEITVGHKKKKQFQSMLASYVMDKQKGKDWPLSDVQTMDGYRSYYKMVEGDTIDRIIEHVGSKFNVNIMEMMKKDLRDLRA